MLARMPASAFHEWMAFDYLEPLTGGPYLDEILEGLGWIQFQLATQNAILANVHRDAKSRPYPYEIGDFMPRAVKADADPQDIWRSLKTWALMNKNRQVM